MRFILLYKGPTPPPAASHEGWPEWFARLGDNLVDLGSPMKHGLTLHNDRSTTQSAANLNGYSIIQADDRDHAVRLTRDHPFLALGLDYTIDVHEVPKSQS